MNKRLTVRELAVYRKATLEGPQGGKCALCGLACTPAEAVADHDHKTGIIRGVLHRGCNAMLGHIENNGPRNNLASITRLTRFLAGVVPYLYLRREDAPLYPAYRTPEEKRVRKNKNAAKARAARKAR